MIHLHQLSLLRKNNYHSKDPHVSGHFSMIKKIKKIFLISFNINKMIPQSLNQTIKIKQMTFSLKRLSLTLKIQKNLTQHQISHYLNKNLHLNLILLIKKFKLNIHKLHTLKINFFLHFGNLTKIINTISKLYKRISIKGQKMTSQQFN